ncbi:MULTISPECIES: hypothetical protein [Streptomyces]|uniref:Lipoprotein n=1 Tax=Streptomyces solicathayae TaxID=3081768 RepID=A0ABZ0LZT9_9ACTN|nr:hypothetical protein [Streptomyces sp. HUAS YS2]WOX25030.1 hypothetical protein R2D22_28045 [Streptomyces sp. HUAS YS2]
MLPNRRLGIAAAAVLLSLAATGCSSLGRTAVGTLTYETEREFVITQTSPSVNGCHRLLAPSGVPRIENRTLNDIILYRTRNCQGKDPIYVATNTSDSIAPGSLPWRSYTVVH